MAAMKAMKAMKTRKAMKKSVIAKGKRARASVFRGSKVRTSSGLRKSDLMKAKTGKIVSKKLHAAGKKAYKNIKPWNTALRKARKALGVKGFLAVRKGSLLYEKAKAIYGPNAHERLMLRIERYRRDGDTSPEAVRRLLAW